MENAAIHKQKEERLQELFVSFQLWVVGFGDEEFACSFFCKVA